jgi:hypothetical protein
MFIFFKNYNYNLVGGKNMTLAFTASGTCFGAFAYMCYYTASRKQWSRHQAWTIRSLSQMLSPVLYRYWYGFLLFCFGYGRDQEIVKSCDFQTEICSDYLRVFDKIHCWTYWLTPLLIAEMVIMVVPPMKEKTPDRKESPLNEQPHDGNEETTQRLLDDAGDSNGGTFPQDKDNYGDPNDAHAELQDVYDSPNSLFYFNVAGVILAAVAVAVTCLIYVGAFRAVSSPSM